MSMPQTFLTNRIERFPSIRTSQNIISTSVRCVGRRHELCVSKRNRDYLSLTNMFSTLNNITNINIMRIIIFSVH